jgi:hypothetical protein
MRTASHREENLRRSIAVSAAIAMLCGIALSSNAGNAGLSKDVVFADYTSLSSNAEIIRRMLSPLAAAQIPDELARTGTRPSDQPVNLANERFVLYVPARKPTQGYGLIVFVPPWNETVLPSDWVLRENATRLGRNCWTSTRISVGSPEASCCSINWEGSKRKCPIMA